MSERICETGQDFCAWVGGHSARLAELMLRGVHSEQPYALAVYPIVLPSMMEHRMPSPLHRKATLLLAGRAARGGRRDIAPATSTHIPRKLTEKPERRYRKS